MDLSQ